VCLKSVARHLGWLLALLSAAEMKILKHSFRCSVISSASQQAKELLAEVRSGAKAVYPGALEAGIAPQPVPRPCSVAVSASGIRE